MFKPKLSLRNRFAGALFAVFLSPFAVQAQLPVVDIDLVPGPTSNQLDVRLRANGASFDEVISNLVFTVRWPDTSPATLSLGSSPWCTSNQAFPLGPSGQQTPGNGFKYRTWTAVGQAQIGDSIDNAGCEEQLPADAWVTVWRINVNNNTGCTAFNIVNDTWTQANNRNFFISLNGQQVPPLTGTIEANGVNAGNCSADCLGVIGGPALPGTACNDNNSCTINDIYDANCNCAGSFQDTDSDGVCDANDNCPTVTGQIGSSCNDNNACTINDVLNASCQCVGTFQDTDSDGVCDANDNCPTVAGQIGSSCNDGNACTINDVLNASCQCVGTFQDTDSDGVCDANDNCPTVAGQIGSSCNDGNACTINDVLDANCNCAGTFQDTDSDGVCDASDSCPTVAGQIGSSCNDGNACTINDVLDANCNCVGTFQDTDSDGVCDANDNCPTVAGQIGSSCNDGNACTINDVLDANCNCTGTFQDTDSDGVCDANDQCPGGPEPGTACNDGNAATSGDVIQANCTCAGVLVCTPGAACNDFNACTTGEVFDANCNCGGGTAVDPNDNNPCTLDSCDPVTGVSNIFQDADGDGVCDANDQCPGGPEPGTACNDGNACTINDVLDANCNCAGTFQDTDSDGVCDANDVCAGGPEPGTPCDDQDANTINDVITANCDCAGVNVNCTNELDLIFTTDANGNETTWEITAEGGGAPLCSGGPYVNNAVVGADCCLADGCYALRVFDAAGDGMTTGGYVLQTDAGSRIIDNRNNFSTGTESAISGGQGFCLPLGTDKLIYTSCDKLDWISGQYVVASPNPAVTAEWVVGGANSVQDANSGYEFWIFDPNGSYSFRRFRSHSVSDGFAASATRACHMKLNNWAASSQVPANTLMNVRIRARVNGVNGEFGPACRLMIDPVRAACPLTKLMDIPSNAQFSCGVTRQYGNGNYVYARPVSGGNRYQFRFSLPAEGFSVTRTSNNYIMQLNWTGPTALQVNKTYDVDVRVSKDGGSTWCTSDSPWGDICLVTIAGAPANTGAAMMAVNNGATAELHMFPNPNRGDLLTFSLSAVQEGVSTVSVDIYDLFGKRVSARTIAVTDGSINTVLDLNGDLAAGMYLVNITAGETIYTERLVIQP